MVYGFIILPASNPFKMSGRSFDKKTSGNRGSPLQPTERQMESLSIPETERLADSKGNKDFQIKPESLESYRYYYENFPKQERERILKEGVQTKDYAILRAYEIHLEKLKGIGGGDIDKTKGRTLKEFEDKFRKLEDRESMVMYDKDGRFVGIANGGKPQEGKPASVSPRFVSGMIVGGTTLHNHPDMGAPIGGSFSIKQGNGGDLVAHKSYGSKTMIVVAREGTYRITTDRMPRYTSKDLEKSDMRVREAQRQFTVEHVARGGKMYDSTYWRGWGLALHEEHQRLASKFGYKYEFKPKKGFDGLYDKKQLDKPLP